MNFEILPNGQVMQVEEIAGAVIKTPYIGCAMDRRIFISAPKTIIEVGEQLNITFQWQKFNTEIGTYEPDPTTDEIVFQVNDQPADTLQPLDGQDTLIFSSLEPGTYTIKTLAPNVNNASLEVVVNA